MLLIVLAGLWAAVLIPATLKSRDHAHDGRTMDGFHTAMRTLSRRTTPTDARRILVPPPSFTAPVPSAPSVARRRAVFLRAVWAVAGTLLLAVAFGGILWLGQLAADAALGGVVTWLRRISVVEAQEARRARREMHAERLRREAAQVAVFTARRSRPAYDELAHRRAVND